MRKTPLGERSKQLLDIIREGKVRILYMDGPEPYWFLCTPGHPRVNQQVDALIRHGLIEERATGTRTVPELTLVLTEKGKAYG